MSRSSRAYFTTDRDQKTEHEKGESKEKMNWTRKMQL